MNCKIGLVNYIFNSHQPSKRNKVNTYFVSFYGTKLNHKSRKELQLKVKTLNLDSYLIIDMIGTRFIRT